MALGANYSMSLSTEDSIPLGIIASMALGENHDITLNIMDDMVLGARKSMALGVIAGMALYFKHGMALGADYVMTQGIVAGLSTDGGIHQKERKMGCFVIVIVGCTEYESQQDSKGTSYTYIQHITCSGMYQEEWSSSQHQGHYPIGIARRNVITPFHPKWRAWKIVA
eukprot:13255798-Ditylum_brightwellii.AAC.1